ncbi:MAG: hypothetical protein ACRDSP_26320 [Pseudonocardiaceae bacterium]
MLVTSPVLASTIGLETVLGIGLLIGLVRYGTGGRWLPAGLTGGLLILTRPDYAVLAVVAALMLPALRRRVAVAAAVATAVAAPWFVASWGLAGQHRPGHAGDQNR